MATITADSSLFTYQDAIDKLLDHAGQNVTQGTVRAVKQSVLEAYDDLVNARNWRYLNKPWRLAMVAPETGTCSYSSSTGEFTIDTGSWPSWAETAIIDCGDVRSLIKTRSSSTALVADDTIRPVADIATGAAFTIFKCIHSLPYDFKTLNRPHDEGENSWAEYVDLSDWLEMLRYNSGGGSPYAFAVSGHPYEPGRQVLLTFPYVDSARTYDFSYQRFPRRLKYNGLDTPCRPGSITASASATITGTSTLFESDMVGAILRWSRDTTNCPDGIGGLNAYSGQAYIKTFSSTTSIVLHETVTIASGTKYTVSDPIDLDRTMHDAFWLGCKRKLAQNLSLPSLDRLERDYQYALQKAKGADSKSTSLRSMWGPRIGSLIRRGIQGTDDL